jgi:hypothetical protein
MTEADPALSSVFTLDEITEWMNGIQIYLKEDVKIVHGHTIYVDSPWAITSISQAQFWSEMDLTTYGDGNVRGILSIDISEWEAKGLNGKTAKECTREEVKAEVWEQLKRSLNYGDNILLKDEQLHQWFLDPDIQLRSGGPDTNEEPLLVNLVDTWKLRPEAVTKIPNMFLAADYVRTFTDLATMEAANEAARRAVNGILDASNSAAMRCKLWQLHEPELFAPWRELDRVRYQQGLPWDDTLVNLGLSAVRLLEQAFVALERGSERHNPLTGVGLDVPSAHSEFISLVDRHAKSGDPSQLRHDVMSMAERLVQTLTLRVAEWQLSRLSSTRSSEPLPANLGNLMKGSLGSESARSGRVRIIPK